ncbi:MAG: choice-of-anchor L domain-containing protein [Flavobacteriales bacterium]
MLKKIVFSLSLIFVVVQSQSQVILDSLAVEEYVQDVLLGNGVQASNISFTGCFAQIAYLHEGNSVSLGIDGGVVLSSDYAKNIAVPSPGYGLWNLTDCPTSSGDADLLSVANSVPPLIGQNFSVSSVNDLSILEFDFVPTGDTIRFNYIFGSDEYLTFVNTTYNDIFGFFLSGPGITGPYNSPAGFPGGAVNIAQVPNSNPPLPITISSVNNVLNQEFYLDNPNQLVLSLNGYTTVLEAWHEVQCGETYHIKLAIADGSDTALESIVILEEGSFSSNAVVDVELSINVGGPEADIIYEDCGEANLIFTRAEVSDLNMQDMIVIDWSGIATMGVDYNEMPDTLIFAPGVTTISLALDAISDGLVEGTELVEMNILNLAACNGSGATSHFQFNIGDEPEPLVVDGFTETICLGETFLIEPIITGGFGNYEYAWSTGDNTPTLEITPNLTTSYFLTVSDTCGMPSDDGEYIIEVGVWDPLAVTLTPNNPVVGCNGVELIATITGGNQVYSNYLWTDENGNNLWGWQNSLFLSSWNPATFAQFSVEDGCGNTATASTNITIEIPDLTVDFETELNAACGSEVTIDPQTQGEAPFFFSWYDMNWNWLSSNPTYTFTAMNDQSIQFSVSDNCGNFISEIINVTIYSDPIEIDLPSNYTASCVDFVNIAPTITGGNNQMTYLWQANGQTIGTGASLNYNTATTTVITLSVSDNCGNLSTATTTLTIENDLPVLTVSEDQSGTCIDEMVYTAEATAGELGSGSYNFVWSAGGNQIGTGNVLTYVFNASTTITCTVTDQCGSTDAETTQFYLDIPPLVLSVTPDSSICRGSSIVLQATTTGGASPISYYWEETGETTSSIVVAPGDDREFNVEVTDMCGQSDMDDIEIEVQWVDALFSFEYLNDVDVLFNAASNDSCADCSYYWNFGDGSAILEPDPTHTFDGLDQYSVSLLVTNELGCTDIAYDVVYPPVSIYIPNAFTPDYDGINDVWEIKATGVLSFEIFVYNRWGQQVYYSNDHTKAWTGGLNNGEYFLEDGIYNYLIKYTGVDGDAQKLKGSLNLLR